MSSNNVLCIAKLKNGMNDLNKALGDISSIRRQVAHSTEFRGYGPATLASTGVLAVGAAGAQALWLPDPEATDRKSTRLNSSHTVISYAVFCLKKKKNLSANV